jgi:hypothetical protein
MRFVVVAIVLVIGLIGLGMSMCGGVFLFSSLISSLNGNFQGGWVLLLSLGSIAVGVLLLWVCEKIYGSVKRG